MGKALLTGYNALAYIFLLAPIAIVLVFSFSDGAGFAFPPSGFSLRWFRYLAGRDEFITAAVVSLQVAALASIGAVALGTPASLALARERFRGKGVVEAVLMGPLVLPGIILGIALLQYFTAIGLTRSFERLVLGHLVVCMPYAIRSISAGLYGIDPSLEEASRTLGASHWRTLRRVVLPQLRPGIAAAFLFSFITSFDNVVISIYLIGADTVTLPIRILNYIEWQFDPSIAAISTIVLVVTIGLVSAAEALTGVIRKTTM
ncbi:MAG: ABC transporter permease [Gemmatimonadetes bacterium]|nr:ABC transporter permease [Gemmatimonadota bacterium]